MKKYWGRGSNKFYFDIFPDGVACYGAGDGHCLAGHDLHVLHRTDVRRSLHVQPTHVGHRTHLARCHALVQSTVLGLSLNTKNLEMYTRGKKVASYVTLFFFTDIQIFFNLRILVFSLFIVEWNIKQI